MFVCLCICHIYAGADKCHRRCQSSGAGVKGSCEPSDSGAGNWTQPPEDKHVLLTASKIFVCPRTTFHMFFFTCMQLSGILFFLQRTFYFVTVQIYRYIFKLWVFEKKMFSPIGCLCLIENFLCRLFFFFFKKTLHCGFHDL